MMENRSSSLGSVFIWLF